ncbi:sodium/solute symporter [Rhodococcus qingshengii]|uniref:sodium/solute symporter n=1 Tax=Rhodococcus qingshengii TaxID=334542 RepID=UPI001C5F43EE|nr:cation acetate symporter [Rhodococcus qingshengii]MBW4818399.1 cation acetate symporter [Rhodococcus qingshengii]
MSTDHAVSWPVVFGLCLAVFATVAIGLYGVRLSRTTSDFLVASRSVSARWNAAAISGEYLSAASFLGVAGLVAKYGFDALWYPVGFTAGYVGLLMFVAAPLRRSGAFTVPDFAEFRLGSARVRACATVVVVVVCVLYLVVQLQGAGMTLGLVLGVPNWVGAVTVGVIVIGNVVAGGMRSVTFVQAFQYWLKLTALAVPAIALSVYFLSDRQPVDTTSPPPVSENTTVHVSSPVEVDVPEPVVVSGPGTVDDVEIAGDVRLDPGIHRLGSPLAVTIPAGSSVPVVVDAPASGADWLAPGRAFGGEQPMYQVYSLIVATFLGTLGLPHVLVRFYTNPDGRAARRTALTVLALLTVFYLLTVILGVLARQYVPHLLTTGTSDTAVLVLPEAVFSGLWGQLLAALVAAGALAAFLSTSSGLLVSTAGVLSTDVFRGRVRDFRIAAAAAGALPVGLAVAVSNSTSGFSLDLSRTVGIVFAVTASTLCPFLVLGIWWRGLTSRGAVAGMIVGGILAGAAAITAVFGGVKSAGWNGWPAAVVAFPAAVTVPIAFGVMIAVSKLTRDRVPGNVGQIFCRMHAPEGYGGSDEHNRPPHR